MFILHSDQFEPKSYLKLIKQYIFSEGEVFIDSTETKYLYLAFVYRI